MKKQTIKAMVGKSKKETNKNDFYATPYEITEDLFKREKIMGQVLEPACGEGHMKKVIEKYNPCIARDKYTEFFGPPMDFIKDDFECFDNIITNPPFTLATEFILKSKKVAKRKIAMILRLQFLEGINRYKNIFSDKDFPLARIYVYSKRVGFGDINNKHVTSAMCFAWFVWDKEYIGDPIIKWL